MKHGSISTEQCSISTEQGSIFTDQGSILCRRVPFIFIGQGFHFYGKGFHFNGSGFHFYGAGFHLYGEGSILPEYGSMFTGQPHVTITNNHRAGPSARPEHTRSCFQSFKSSLLSSYHVVWHVCVTFCQYGDYLTQFRVITLPE